ncbi:type II toxin-antitoxin system PemK/MazF family toxin [Geodermatophilus marinus]|uniref:type II toxin-antitoxin system PemK/MazF family toxin n=1 Tax=Geodermatophilus sp. LHW52908 TaxID=2303986 RepID=UPI001F31D7A5|nr:type II toxin-antitoxin system PemK/MazF family toxin [Geodermatophilus sp. LHW52908]
MASTGRRLVGLLRAALGPAVRAARDAAPRPAGGVRRRSARRAPGPVPPVPAGGSRPGGVRDLDGPLGAADLSYRPRDDGRPDPGEVVWAWVPYDEADGRGKDRPVLVLGRRGADLVGLMLSSQDHDRDAADEARHGRYWMDVGRGGWDPRGRPSEARLDRPLLLPAGATRREGAALDRERFTAVLEAALALDRRR